MRMDLNIDRLVLDGFEARDRFHIRVSIERELTQVLAKRGVPKSLRGGHEMGSLRTGSVHVPARLNAETIASKVARSIYGDFDK